MRLLPIFAVLGIAMTCLPATADARAVDSTFCITYWLGPPATDERCAESAEANFTVAGPPTIPPSVEENLRFLDICRKHGMKAIISDARILARNPGTPDFEKNLDSVVADYSKHPALYGYYLCDEPGPGLFPLIGGVTQSLLKKDPAHVPYVNIYPNYVDPAGIGGVSYAEHVEQYMSEVKPALLAYDHYALFDGYERDSYFENLEQIRDAALKHGTPWMSTVLITPHYAYRDPNEADLRWQVYTNLAYGGRGIGYYTYWTPAEVELGYRNGIIDREGKPTEHYWMVRRVNGEIKALAPTLLELKSTGVYHTGVLPSGTKPLPKGTAVKHVLGADVVVGLFDGPGDSRWVMLVNRSPRKPARVTVTFAAPQRLSEVDKSSGRLRVAAGGVQADPTTWNLAFQPGEGRLFLLGPAGR